MDTNFCKRLGLSGGMSSVALAEQEFVSASAFREWVEGRVVRTDYADGTPFGIEEFGYDGAVVWRDYDGTCLIGRWKPEGGSICYQYEGRSLTSCLRYQSKGAALIGFQWINGKGPLGFTGSVLRLTPTTNPPIGCSKPPTS